MTRDYRNIAGRLIRAARIARGMTLAEVAAIVGCTPANVSHMEAGRQSVSMEQLDLLAMALGVPVAVLMPGVGPAPGGDLKVS